MAKFATALLTLILMVAASSPSLAHRPYFTQVEPIILPNGQPGEMRVLRGDGIIIADPSRILVLDSNRRLLARSGIGDVVSILCDGDRRACRGHSGLATLILDPASFRLGPVVPGLEQNDRSGLYELMDGNASWGFTVQLASVGDVLRAEAAIFRQHLLPLSLIAVLGAVAATILIAGKGLPNLAAWRAFALWIVGFLLRLAGTAPILFIAAYVFLLTDVTLLLWLASFGSGASLMWLAVWLRRRRLGANPA